MSLEVFEKLESKVQQAIDTITLLQMEIEELKEKNNSLSQEVQNAQHSREADSASIMSCSPNSIV
ncbi:cell division protein ZapB [Enterobacter hormaechei]|nr:cell division protein ZapB [Enterobacter hormaechei]